MLEKGLDFLDIFSLIIYMLPPKEQLQKLKRGTVEIITEDELLAKLERSYKTGKPLKIKQGFDPTAPDLHIGHAVSLRKLRQFQDLGHIVIFLIGDFTGLIGDPSGRDKARKKMTREEVLRNAETYKQQVFKILDPERTIIEFNSRWNEPLTFSEFLEQIASRYTVARILERDDFEKRLKERKPLSILEFMYPLIQGYDSVALGNDVELGGTDQKFNLLVGRDLQREFGQEEQVVMTMPLLEGLDGKEKMSKSMGNYIGINEPPDDMFGKVMSIPDSLIYKYFELATAVPESELEGIKISLEKGTANPMELKKRLAFEITSLYWGAEKAEAARQEFERVFQRREIPSEIAVAEYPKGSSIWVVEIMRMSGLVPSSSEGIRLIRSGAVSIDGVKIEDTKKQIVVEKEMVLRVGRLRFLKIKPQEES